jgi:hypothetical protein
MRTKAGLTHDDGGEMESVSGQPILDAEKNLTRNTTKDSSPPVGEEGRATVSKDKRGEDGD